MPYDQVAAELHRLLERAGVDPTEVSAETALVALHLDSIDYTEILEAIHTRFGIDIDPVELRAAGTVGRAVDVIDARVREAEAA